MKADRGSVITLGGKPGLAAYALRVTTVLIQNLLEPRNRDRLIVALLLPADHLLAHAQPPGQFGLRDALCNPDLCDERRYLIHALDVG